jgi:surface carbohydrate biosynthesis protein (TIGR04326 family)
MHYLPENSPDLGYLPDSVITNGQLAARFLTSRNYPEGKVITGGALRYSAILKRALASPRPGSPPPGAVLVTLPIEADESVELLDKVYEALAGDTGITIWCKPHPFLPPDLLARSLPGEVMSRVQFTRDPLDSLLPGMGAVIYSTSISCIDALVMGVPVLKILSERRIDIDPVGEFQGKTPFIHTARTPAEISREVHAILGLKFTADERSRLAGLIGEIFSPVTDETYAAFTIKKTLSNEDDPLYPGE